MVQSGGSLGLFIGYYIAGVRHFHGDRRTPSLEYRPFAAYAYSGAAVWVCTFLERLLFRRPLATGETVHRHLHIVSIHKTPPGCVVPAGPVVPQPQRLLGAVSLYDCCASILTAVKAEWLLRSLRRATLYRRFGVTMAAASWAGWKPARQPWGIQTQINGTARQFSALRSFSYDFTTAPIPGTIWSASRASSGQQPADRGPWARSLKSDPISISVGR